MQILQVFMVSFIVLAMIFMFLWSTLIDPLFYSPYLYRKYVVSKFSEQNTFDLLKDTAAISQKIRSIPIVNLYKEQIENVEDTLGFEVLPIEFDQSIIDSELNHIEYSLLKDEIKSFSQQNQLPLRMIFHSKTKGIDEIEMVKETFQHRYPTITFFEIDELVSLPFIKHLLTKNIVLLGICGYTHNYNGSFQLLLLPYEKKIDRSNRRAYQPIPTGTVECE